VKWKRIIVAFLVVAALLRIALLGPLGDMPYVPRLLTALGLTHREFNSAQWKRDDAASSYGRARMVWSLVREHDLVGMKRSDALRLLGQPAGGQGAARLPALWYYLGWHASWVRGPSYLVLEFGPDDRIVEWRLTQDSD
jgi:hypothetical protein